MSDPLVLGDIQNRWYTVLCNAVFRGTGAVENPYGKHHSSVMLQENDKRNRVSHTNGKSNNVDYAEIMLTVCSEWSLYWAVTLLPAPAHTKSSHSKPYVLFRTVHMY